MQKPDDYSWEEQGEIGRGSFGIIVLGMDLKVGKQMAVKKLPADKKSEKLKEAMKEMNLLSQLRNKHIVNFEGYQFKGDTFYIFMEYVSGGSIENQVLKYGKLSEELVRKYSKQILKGLEYLHSKKVVHGDIKCANILTTKNGTCKLADFGSAQKILGKNQAIDSLIGSVYWMAPEVIKQNGIDFYSDIWSFGATAYEMLVGYPPFYDTKGNQFKIMHKIAATKVLPYIGDDVSEEARDFVYSCLKRNPNERLTVQQLLEHPFMKEEKKEIASVRIINTSEIPKERIERGKLDGMIKRILEKRKVYYPKEILLEEGEMYVKGDIYSPLKKRRDNNQREFGVMSIFENYNDGRHNQLKDLETDYYFDKDGNKVLYKKFLDPEFEPIIENPINPYEKEKRKTSSLAKRRTTLFTQNNSKNLDSKILDYEIDISYKEDDKFDIQIQKLNNFIDNDKDGDLIKTYSPKKKKVKFDINKFNTKTDTKIIESDSDVEEAIENCLDLLGNKLIFPSESKISKNNEIKNSNFIYL